MRRLKTAAPLFAALLLGGCVWFGGDQVGEARLQQLDAARERWAATNLDSYSYVVSRSCECQYIAPTRVVVVRGSVARLELEASGDTLPADARSSFHTVNGLFDVIADAISRDPYHFEADYDPQAGYPTLFSVDYSREVADDEIVVRARDLETLPVF